MVFYVRHEMIIDKVQEIFSFQQCKWLENQIDFNNQKRSLAIDDLKNDCYKLLKNAFCGRTMENELSRLEHKVIKEENVEEFIEQQSKLNFSGTHKS